MVAALSAHSQDMNPSVSLSSTLHPCNRAVVPIGALYAGTLWLGNAAYLYLSVSFIQMLKVSALLAGTFFSCLRQSSQCSFHGVCLLPRVQPVRPHVSASKSPALQKCTTNL
jgi:hypothetical protein